MQKREFLTGAAGLLAGVASGSFNQAFASTRPTSNAQTILTITGDIKRTNRGKMNVVDDQLMHKFGITFEKAYTFSLADIEKLPSKTIHPTTEFDERVHALSGPRLVDVLNVVGVKDNPETTLRMRGIDGYSPEMTLGQAKEYDFIVATRLDNQVLSIGGLGPLYALYDADRIEKFAKMPMAQRFSGCPWGLYCIEVG